MEQGFWRGNVPALMLYMPYTAIQFTVLHALKTFASGSSKTGIDIFKLFFNIICAIIGTFFFMLDSFPSYMQLDTSLEIQLNNCVHTT